ncbi:unnamed protein product [Umbelopsis vinacea]
MPAEESNHKTEKRASSQTSQSKVNAPIAKKRKLTPAEALIKSLQDSHVTFGDNAEVIEKKPTVPEEDQKKKKIKNKNKKKSAGKDAGSTISTASIFSNGSSSGSILPTSPAIEYLRAWKSDPQSWKFQKVRQTWLLANIYDDIKIKDEDFAILLDYLQELKGKARQTTIEEATQIHQQYPDGDESESETEDKPAADDNDDDEFDAEKMMAKAQKQAQSAKAQEQKQEHQVAKKKARRAMELLRTLS